MTDISPHAADTHLRDPTELRGWLACRGVAKRATGGPASTPRHIAHAPGARRFNRSATRMTAPRHARPGDPQPSEYSRCTRLAIEDLQVHARAQHMIELD